MGKRNLHAFTHAPFDEVALFERVKNNAASTLTKKLITEALQQGGIEYATAVLYHHLTLKHEDFINKVHVNEIRATTPQKPTKLIFVPAMFYREHPNVGGDGALLRSIAQQFGFETSILPLNSRGSVLKNTEIIKQKLTEERHPNIWVVSMSKGSTEARLALEELTTVGIPTNIKGWVSISGLCHGSPLADMKIRSMPLRLYWRTVCAIMGIEYAFTEESTYSNKRLQKEIAMPNHLEIIHIAGFPLSAHLHPLLQKRYEILAPYGPNDGLMILQDFIETQGHVYPVWGADHFLRTPQMSTLIYQLCNYINKHQDSPYTQQNN